MSKLTRSTLIRYIVLAGIASFVIIFLIMQFTTGFDFGKAIQSIVSAKWWWILVALGVNLLSFVFETLQLVFLGLALGKKPRFWRMMQIYFVGNFFSNATPSTSGGEPFQVFFLLDDSYTIAEGTVMVMIRGLISVMVRILFVVGIVIATFFGFQLTLSKTLDIIFYITLSGFGLIVIGGIAVLLNPFIFTFFVRFLSRFRWVRKLAKTEDPDDFVAKGTSFLNEIRGSAKLMLSRNKIFIVLAIFNSMLTWMLLKSMPFFVMLALSESPSILGVFAIGVVSQLATAWVPTPGAVGGIEIGMNAFAALMTEPSKNIGIFVLIYRLMDYHMDVFIGAPVALSLLTQKFGAKAKTTDFSTIGSTIETQMELEKHRQGETKQEQKSQ